MTWRVMCEGGEVRTPGVARSDDGPWTAWVAVTNDPSDDMAGHGRTARIAVLALAHLASWPVAEIVAPDETTAAERVAAAERERDAAEADRDYWREQAAGMAPSVDGMRALGTRLFLGGTGCVVDPERVVAEVDSLLAAYDRLDTEASRRAGKCAEAMHCTPADDTARAEAAALRAIIEGRAQAPTDAEIAAHAGEWLVRSRAVRWWPLDATGRPTTWPTGGDL